ncbi:MAG: response regulator [Deferribacterales bacterium]|nr:response regulator [Deferribacterales bacterium]
MAYSILIVDDEADIRFLFSTELQDAGYQVFEASNSDECFKILETEKIDLCLLDIKLKGESGIDILRRVTAEYKHIKTLLATAYSAYQDDVSTWSADGYWVKSQDMEALKDEVKKVLAK